MNKRILLIQTILLVLIGGIFLFIRYSQKNTAADTAVRPSVNNQTVQPPISEPEAEESRPDLSGLSLPIFMYHHVRPMTESTDATATGLTVSPEKFADHLDFITAKGYTPTTFRDLQSGQIPAKPVILTFDDGYVDFYTYAFPELKKRGMKAVVYVITGHNGGDYLTSSQIKELFESGIEIGSHTVSHIDLANASENRVEKELTESKTFLENLLAAKIISLCYPSGKFSDNVLTAVEKADYNFAVTTQSGLAHFDAPFQLNRYRITEETHISAYIK